MAPVASKPVVSAEAPPAPANDNIAHAIAGAGGGILSTVLTYPLITLSTRAQVESKRAESSFVHAAKHIVAREGVAGLYAGLDSAVFGIGVTNFVYYYWFEWTRAFFERAAAARDGKGRAGGRLTTVEAMIAGAIAGSATVILTNPIWVVNTRMTTRRRPETSKAKETKEGKEDKTDANSTTTDEEAVLVETDKAAKEVSSPSLAASPAAPPTTIGTLLALLREEGPQALFAGVVPALVLVINPILQYTLFEQLKNRVQARRKGQPFTPGLAFIITVKSRMHVAKTRNPGGVTAALRRVVQEEGYAGLYKGACVFSRED